MFCKKCGTEMPDGAKFCAKCGAPMHVVPANPKEPEKKKPIAAIAAALVILILAVGSIILYSLKDIRSEPDYERRSGREEASVEKYEAEEMGAGTESGTGTETQAPEEDLAEALAETENAEPEEIPISEKEEVVVDITQIDTSVYPDITLYFTVSDLMDNYIDTITSDDITLFEGDVTNLSPIYATGFTDPNTTSEHSSVAFVMDTSGSMHASIAAEENAAISIIQKMNAEGDFTVSVTAFNDVEQELIGFTDDLDQVCSYLPNLIAGGSTALYDTLENSIYKTASQEGKKYILAFTDGLDNRSSITSDELIELAKRYRIPIFIISLTDDTHTGEMTRIATESGGAFYRIYDISELSGIYDEIFNRQQHVYSCSYTTSLAQDWFDLQVTCNSDEYYGEGTAEFWAERTYAILDSGSIARVYASSVLDPQSDSQGTYNYIPENIIDQNFNTAWVEGVSGPGIGEYIVFEFDKTYTLNGIEIANGYKKRYELYLKNHRAKEIEITFSDGSSVQYVLADDFSGVERIDFSSAVQTSSVKITILSVYSGTKYDDTCLTEVSFY